MPRPFAVFGALFALFAVSAHADDAETADATAVFAGGCFWCTEADFEKLPGVSAAVSGYTGGTTDAPTYYDVTGGATGHYEAVKVTYDPQVVSYAQLVEYFWRTIDPTDPNGQFCDKGSSYRTAFFPGSDEERAIVEASLATLTASGRFDRIETVVLDRAEFWDAEHNHQDFYKRNPFRYGAYRAGCGRDRRLGQLWGDEAGGGAVKREIEAALN